LLRRPCYLLGLEQHAVGAATGRDHEQARRQGGGVGQRQGAVREEEGGELGRTLLRHARAWRGHPRLSCHEQASRGCPPQWPGMTKDRVAPERPMPSPFSRSDYAAGHRLFGENWDFLTAAASIESLPRMDGLEIAFAGRSNVGKSSLINA